MNAEGAKKSRLDERGEFLDVGEAARYCRTTERHVRGRLTRGELPFYRVGRLIRIATADLDAYLDANRVEVQ